MTNIHRAVRNIIQRHLAWGVKEEDYLDEVVIALADAGYLMPDPQIIRTVDELEALDPDTLCVTSTFGNVFPAMVLHKRPKHAIPAVVIATGEQVRAARTALQEATE